jgi:hypothetical protein
MRTQGSRLLVTSGKRRIWHLYIGLPGLALASALASTGACVRDPLPSTCPELAPGDLVVTEIRGDQAGSYRQWIEIYNPTDAAIPVAGLRITLTQFDGDGSQTFLVRDEALELPPGEYLVLGGGDPATLDYIDYDFSLDQPGDLYAGGTLELRSCATLVDKLIYTLPEAGTLALDGAVTPSAAANDDSKLGWCVDDQVSEGPQTQIGIRGTPGGANPPCP